MKYNCKVPEEFETCPLCNEKIYYWKHYIACEYTKQRTIDTREKIERAFKYLELKNEQGDVMEKLFTDQNWNFI